MRDFDDPIYKDWRTKVLKRDFPEDYKRLMVLVKEKNLQPNKYTIDQLKDQLKGGYPADRPYEKISDDPELKKLQLRKYGEKEPEETGRWKAGG